MSAVSEMQWFPSSGLKQSLHGDGRQKADKVWGVGQTSRPDNVPRLYHESSGEQ